MVSIGIVNTLLVRLKADGNLALLASIYGFKDVLPLKPLLISKKTVIGLFL